MSAEPPALQLAKRIATAFAKEGLLMGDVEHFADRLARGDISAEGWKTLVSVTLPKAGPE